MRDIYILLDDTHDVTQKETKLLAFDRPSIPQSAFKLIDIVFVIRSYIITPLMSFFTIERMFQHVYPYLFIYLLCRYV